MPSKCVVKGCTKSSPRRFTFPTGRLSKDRFLKWLAAAGNHENVRLPMTKLRKMRICELHFEPKYILRTKLSSSAIPTLRLPEEIDVSGFDIDQSKTKHSPLSYFNLRRQTPLSPQEKRLYNDVARLRITSRKMQKRRTSFASRIEQAENLVENGTLQSILELPQADRIFLRTYFWKFDRDNYRRKFTRNDKITSLALYKKNPRAYVFLRKIFSLPKVATLRSFVDRIPTRPGYCSFVFESIGEKIDRFGTETAKYCILEFGETSLKPFLHRNYENGTVDGFSDRGYEREPEIADHAMIWMLKSVQGIWKQPVAYSFSRSREKSENIARTFVDIVRGANEKGLKIVSLICHPNETNVRAIRILIDASECENLESAVAVSQDNIVIDGRVIVPLFDPPNLLRSVGNIFTTNDVSFTLKDDVERIAKWSDVVSAYEFGKIHDFPGITKKLTDADVYVDKIGKTSVKRCIRVFSRTVAATVDLWSRWCEQSPDNEITVNDTAKFIEIMDNLFDSVNGDWTNFTDTSIVTSDWDDFVDFVRTFKFTDSTTGEPRECSIVNKWVATLQAFKYLKSYLRELGFVNFSTRIFNSDAIANFFGRMKYRDMKGAKLTCANFQSYYKTFLLNDFRSKNVKSYGRCRETSFFFIDTETLTTAEFPVRRIEFVSQSKRLAIDPQPTFEIKFDAFARKVRASVGKCKICRENVSRTNDRFVVAFRRMSGLTIRRVSRYVHLERFERSITDELKTTVQFGFKKCDHAGELINRVIKICIETTITAYLEIVNGSLSGNEVSPQNAEDT